MVRGILSEFPTRNQRPREENCQDYARENGQRRHKGRLYEEAERDGATLIADRSKHPDVLPPLYDGAKRDHPDRGDAYKQTQAHEALHQTEEVAEQGALLLGELLQGVRLDSRRKQARLYLLCHGFRRVRIVQADVMHRKLRLPEYRPECVV